jgi:hypothetical protein
MDRITAPTPVANLSQVYEDSDVEDFVNDSFVEAAMMASPMLPSSKNRVDDNSAVVPVVGDGVVIKDVDETMESKNDVKDRTMDSLPTWELKHMSCPPVYADSNEGSAPPMAHDVSLRLLDDVLLHIEDPAVESNTGNSDHEPNLGLGVIGHWPPMSAKHPQLIVDLPPLPITNDVDFQVTPDVSSVSAPSLLANRSPSRTTIALLEPENPTDLMNMKPKLVEIPIVSPTSTAATFSTDDENEEVTVQLFLKQKHISLTGCVGAAVFVHQHLNSEDNKISNTTDLESGGHQPKDQALPSELSRRRNIRVLAIAIACILVLAGILVALIMVLNNESNTSQLGASAGHLEGDQQLNETSTTSLPSPSPISRPSSSPITRSSLSSSLPGDDLETDNHLPVASLVSTVTPTKEPSSFLENESFSDEFTWNVTISNRPSMIHTVSSQPSLSPIPTSFPSDFPSLMPSVPLTAIPTISSMPSTLRPVSEIELQGLLTTTFYVTGDAPYNDFQAQKLFGQMVTIPEDAEFVVHVGDIRMGNENVPCVQSEYQSASDIIQISRAPVFMLLGDNEWNDCPNPDDGLQLWRDVFGNYDTRYWNHTINVTRPENLTESFSFIHKYNLFVGLNMVGGRVLDVDQWRLHFETEANRTIQLIRSYDQLMQTSFPLRNNANGTVTGRVVIFGHAFPKTIHNYYFEPLNAYMAGELQNRIPIIYINGDNHEWLYEPNFFGQPNFLRIMITGTAAEAPTRISITATGQYASPEESFVYERRY